MNIKIKRIYKGAEPEDGRRIMVDRLWPRGVSKANAKINLWVKNIAPSTELRKWYSHDPKKWQEFKSRYFSELNNNSDEINNLLDQINDETVTFVFGSKEQHLNNAVALKEYLETNLK